MSFISDDIISSSYLISVCEGSVRDVVHQRRRLAAVTAVYTRAALDDTLNTRVMGYRKATPLY